MAKVVGFERKGIAFGATAEGQLVGRCGLPLWIGRTSGGWGNGPYSTFFQAAEERPQDEILTCASDWREADVTLSWRPLTAARANNLSAPGLYRAWRAEE